jgi:Ca2+-binding EF-hand superfamily protein
MCRGVVTYQEFINALNLPDCALIQQVFSYFDLRDQGFINFSQYAAGIAFIAKHEKHKEAIQATFRFFHGDGDELLDKAQAQSSFHEIIPSITNQQVHIYFSHFLSLLWPALFQTGHGVCGYKATASIGFNYSLLSSSNVLSCST